MKKSPEELMALYKNGDFLVKLRRKALESEESEFLKRYPTCPSCKAHIEKFDGCNKVTCICGTVICYICRKKIAGYDHFNSGCNLWSETAGRVPVRERNPVIISIGVY